MEEGELKDTDHLIDIQLDEVTFVRRRPEVEHERAVAIFDLLEDNHFGIKGFQGPFRLVLSLAENRLLFDIRDGEDKPLRKVILSLRPFRMIVKDYFMICESYFSAIRSMTPAQIEAIDMGRRGLHNEGGAVLKERLAGKVVVDHDTARRLFTLICVLHARG
ncbi:UPF0262 family protein [Rhodospirillum rubrum]|uniref:UPF0262 protein Rru_A2770 n=1 Tax=Rhodospirillum rubrum (strain ATCC 11170 / ATH 1.1.1 / DSM 467 / LMG 4362 / NCIMB 8255 / S1) TaxID=269796 RepID=Y2770_RHORT|nr:UPF0262 family protein [Rhodospirillum rubrum]Q2RQM8.1 RecName: Full=UPF0262 protein Rru_A2770 [Rhodospirillum rubrum ATCC 11170]ABC23567.1 Uncharacterized conserved protein UCP032146 [Rhodospirillum rubrum ATCC 11170]AEO49305.1 hypothetical protein F11_14215 [Rhodospirillum rubrum F11]MBK5955242.1 hypothetical protein [Rhodospirillum rubrum]QXG79532.1 UPF0262 family protein [Rhodospirillum rubrum]HAQ00887.1 UPF0262 family protein [Rhodospirillum rubrum]